ncbi:MAG: hypothetical protein PHC37_01020 [Candidatus Omnitrophica bacterium]|nr:hypothetical protein [Candidatus Omnitrophota bacterium]MDD5690273.1 hypothetical protein [Candidatus Omnitrophota bacterium]
MQKDLLKEFYLKERKKLEDGSVFKHEEKLKFLNFKKEILSKAVENLNIPQILGRADILEEAKDTLIRDRGNADKIDEDFSNLIGAELSAVEKELEEAFEDAKYPHLEFAEYLFQLEKVSMIEGELENNQLIPEAIYEEQKDTKEKTGGGA